MSRSAFVVPALATLFVGWATPSWAATAEEVRACSDAARAMIRAEATIRTGGGASSRSVGGETISWDSADGYSGVCKINQQGRLYQVEISRFPVVGGPGWGGGGFTPYYVSCSSADNRYRECPLQNGGRVELVRRESRADCVEGRSWGYSPRSIWVDLGCRATFRVSPASGGGGSEGDLSQRARAACIDYARGGGVSVLRVTDTRDLGSVIDVTLNVTRQGILSDLTCRYDKRSGSTYWLNR